MTDNKDYPRWIKEAHDDWNDKDHAARMLEDTKTLVFNQKCAALGDIPVNRAEQTIKASKDWHDYVVTIVEAKTEANRAWAEYEYRKNQYDMWKNEEANHRAEARL
jgi:hypothetical protein